MALDAGNHRQLLMSGLTWKGIMSQVHLIQDELHLRGRRGVRMYTSPAAYSALDYDYVLTTM